MAENEIQNSTALKTMIYSTITRCYPRYHGDDYLRIHLPVLLSVSTLGIEFIKSLTVLPSVPPVELLINKSSAVLLSVSPLGIAFNKSLNVLRSVPPVESLISKSPYMLLSISPLAIFINLIIKIVVLGGFMSALRAPTKPVLC